MKARVKVDCTNLTRRRVSVALVRRVIARAVAHFERTKTRTKTVEVSIAFVSENAMRRLNRAWRGKDRATDVLSFGFLEKGNTPSGDARAVKRIGEIVVCPAYAARDAKRLGVAAARTMATLAVHGIIHLYGVDHERSQREEKQTERIQKKIVEICH